MPSNQALLHSTISPIERDYRISSNTISTVARVYWQRRQKKRSEEALKHTANYKTTAPINASRSRSLSRCNSGNSSKQRSAQLTIQVFRPGLDRKQKNKNIESIKCDRVRPEP